MVTVLAQDAFFDDFCGVERSPFGKCCSSTNGSIPSKMAAVEEARLEYMECIEDFMKDMRKAAESSSKVVEELIKEAKSSLKVLKDRKAKCQLELEGVQIHHNLTAEFVEVIPP
uniref:Uncharacterized protein n=1 Tax=Angiostrongylus cantonensis TaxID=6313 RepID=A0A0K0D5V4_ANGCA